MKLPQRVRHELLLHAAEEAPREACGLLLYDDLNNELVHFLPLANVAPEPERSFELAPIDLALWTALEERAGCRIVLFHSHPVSPAHPSHADLRFGREGQRVLIASLGTHGRRRGRAEQAAPSLLPHRSGVPRLEAGHELRAFVYQRHGDTERFRTRMRAVEIPLDVLER